MNLPLCTRARHQSFHLQRAMRAQRQQQMIALRHLLPRTLLPLPLRHLMQQPVIRAPRNPEVQCLGKQWRGGTICFKNSRPKKEFERSDSGGETNYCFL